MFTESAETVDFGEAINFYASASSDPDCSIVSYSWDLCDGSTATGITTSHSYTDDGTYTLTLKVTDHDSATYSTNATKIVLLIG